MQRCDNLETSTFAQEVRTHNVTQTVCGPFMQRYGNDRGTPAQRCVRHVAPNMRYLRVHNVSATLARFWQPGGYEESASWPDMGILHTHKTGALRMDGRIWSEHDSSISYNAGCTLCACKIPKTGEEVFSYKRCRNFVATNTLYSCGNVSWTWNVTSRKPEPVPGSRYNNIATT